MMTFSQLAPIWRGMIGWTTLAIVVLDVFSLLVQWKNRIPGRVRQLFFSAAALAELYVLLKAIRLLSGEMAATRLSAWICAAPTGFILLALLAEVAEVAYAYVQIVRWQNRHITFNSIKEGMDCLPTALCFYWRNGLPLLTNHTMNRIVMLLTGEPLRNGTELWRHVEENGPILRLADGSCWSFRHDTLQIERKPIERITAVDVTWEYQLTRELQEKNRQIRRMNERLMAYGKTVEESTREREVLETKVRIHDNLGKVLLASRRSISGNAAERAQVLQSWKQAVALFDCREDAPRENAPLKTLIEAARSIGVTITMEGAFPAAGTRAAECMISAAHECLTNAVRHADAAELRISGSRQGDLWRLQYTNDGRAPTEEIREGGGLSGLRHRVESAGGSMEIRRTPQFALILSIFEEQTEKEEPAWSIA